MALPEWRPKLSPFGDRPIVMASQELRLSTKWTNQMQICVYSLVDCVRSIEDKLDTTPLITQLPLGAAKDFTGVIDLVTMELLVWGKGGDGSRFTRLPLIPKDNENRTGDFTKLSRLSELVKDTPLNERGMEEALEARNNLAEQVITLDNELMEMLARDSLEPLTISDLHLRGGIRRLTRGQLVTPILCGSSLRNIGVQPLMDAIVEYLPSPLERGVTVPESLKDLYAYAFKVSYDRRRGHMVYLRIYSGELKPQNTVHNITRKVDERITRVLLMMADEQKEMQSMAKGNIAVAVGMKNTYTGDTIVLSSTAAASASADSTSLSLEVLDLPPPVFFCSVEPSSAAYQKDLDHALSCLTREDPSLRVTVNEDTAQTVLSGMGELHLEIVHDRLVRDYGIECSLGKLQVAYREAPTVSITKEVTKEQTLGGKKHTVTCTLTVEPDTGGNHGDKPLVQLKTGRSTIGLGHSKAEILEAVVAGVDSACLQGPLLAFPVQNVGVSVTSLSLGSVTSLTVLSACIAEGVVKALRESCSQLLEPCTELVVSVPDEQLGPVLSDLTSQRRAQVREVAVAKDTRVIHALVPLAALMGYSTALRSLTSGTGTFSATFTHYEPVSKEQEKTIRDTFRGYSF
ncbi:ribosome-releasing factor 2, mitochondrial-like isoform X2 [Halichondria panicea]|uniref:ribosome-releasing factor 2, mitochondrial-like isoform X2 n=1 Tax=Halichondria panicea TaxID=6063 RepID=UPI00312B734D